MSKQINILVTGSNGQLGSELKELVPDNNQCNFFFADKKILDITNLNALKDYFRKYQIDYCVNTAAYTAVDNAEKDKESALKLNASGVSNIVEACKLSGAKLLHISTDFVFDGTGTIPYVETDKTNPLSVYGLSKLKGEKFALDANHIVIRTSWLYSCKYGNNFLKTMTRLGLERDELNIIDDQKGTPTNAKDLALTLLKIILYSKKDSLQGLYHFSNAGEASWYDFAKEIFELSNIDCKVNPIPTTEYPTPAERPKYSVMDKTKIVDEFSIELIDWKESLSSCFTK